MKILTLVWASGLAATTFYAGAQSGSYPNKPIRMIVPFAPGGGTDIAARTLAQKLTESFKQSVVVDNRAGGGGSVGTETAVRAAPDGYTMIFVSASYGANAALYSLPFDAIKDVQAVAEVGESCFIVALHPSVPAKNIKELIAYAKANPGKVNYGSTGTGGVTHLASELFNLLAGVNTTHIPYKGTGPALNDLIGGQVQLLFGSMPAVLPHVKVGRVRGLAVTTITRNSLVPDLPTVADSVPGYEAPLWYGVLGPKNLPNNVVALWSAEISKAVQTREMKERMAAEGLDAADTSSRYFTDTIARDVAKWKRVVKEAKIQVTQ